MSGGRGGAIRLDSFMITGDGKVGEGRGFGGRTAVNRMESNLTLALNPTRTSQTYANSEEQSTTRTTTKNRISSLPPPRHRLA